MIIDATLMLADLFWTKLQECSLSVIPPTLMALSELHNTHHSHLSHSHSARSSSLPLSLSPEVTPVKATPHTQSLTA